MRIAVTGAGGFIGSHLVQSLLHRGHAVCALVRYNSQGGWGHLDGAGVRGADGLVVRPGDVRDPDLVRALVEGCDVVLHLAALVGIPYSYQAPASYVAVNIGGTLNVLEACRQAGTRRVVVTSTSEVYGTAQYTPIDEAHPLQGQSPYSASKIAADKLAESYVCSYGLPVVVVRPFNTYGPRQSARAVIPTVLTQALRGASEVELGNLGPRRDLTFVEDIVEAFMLAMEKPDIDGETIHFGQGTALTVRELAEACLLAVGSAARLVTTPERVRPERSEVGLLVCDASKAHRLLKWKPRVSLEDGLRRTAEYVRTHLAQYPAREYVV
ncbi:MAG TPA: GDP-mannose 4,6-dehydratase [Candidatus Methylomirabilis sp.]|nr:GDP-mannose 4,6-dehydratase [Candidatus Methylomirabilis sp.]